MLQVKIENCSQDNVDFIIDFLEENGALSVTMLDQFDSPILEPELGTMPLWPNIIVEALYSADFAIDVLEQELCSNYPDIKFVTEILPEQNWEKLSLDSFKPQEIGDSLLICPSWITPDVDDRAILTLDPGLAFGTGSHATTFLCLSWLASANVLNKDIIDYGCGSGIIGLAALQLGARHVFAVDIDEQALISTRNNAALNKIDDKLISISQPEFLREKVDIIFANILLKTLIVLKEEFVRLLKKQGILVVSGVLLNQIDELVDEYQTNFRLVSRQVEQEWAVVVFELISGFH